MIRINKVGRVLFSKKLIEKNLFAVSFVDKYKADCYFCA